MATPEMVQVTIDGHEIEVPAGTGLVEAAAKLDVEIPVFCYEPRIGPAIGACRMCLVEIEGMPKLQTACSTGARQGMNVSTVNARAREAQEAMLEFLLINHPLDCPVCDKGGECPLQDHAFRWGPGSSRFVELKRNSDKPIPISPLIALDRERCILCFRCTRFSAEVSHDNQLITRERGASSVIATFEGRPYEGHFSGNVIELCPVGALTSTEYRFKARPWEAPDHPTVCGLCPVGCNTYATVREGKIVRVLARENDAVDGGWLCDRGRFSYPSLYGDQRVVVPQIRDHRERPVGNRPLREASSEVALEWLYQKVSGTTDANPAVWLLSGSEPLEEAFAIQQIAAATGAQVLAVPGGAAAAPPAPSAATIDDLVHARHILIVGDADLAEVAPILDLRVRKAQTAGASVTVAGIGGTRLEPAGAHHEFAAPGQADTWVQQYVPKMREAMGNSALTEPGVVIYTDGALAQSSLDQLADLFSLSREGSGFIAIPAAANARGLAALGIEQATAQDLRGTGGLIFFNVDTSRLWTDEQWRPAVREAAFAVAVTMFDTPVTEVADLILPATSSWEKEGSLVNLEGRLQRLTVGALPPDEVRGELSWLSGLARRLGASVPSHAAGTYRLLSAANKGRFPATTHSDIPAEGILGVQGGLAPVPTAHEPVELEGDQLTAYVGPFLYDGIDVEHAPRMQFLRDATYATLARADAQRLGLARGDAATVQIAGRAVPATIAVSKRLQPGYVRLLAGSPGVPSQLVGYHAASVSRASVAAEVVG